jgi:hypothetical protein
MTRNIEILLHRSKDIGGYRAGFPPGTPPVFGSVPEKQQEDDNRDRNSQQPQ